MYRWLVIAIAVIPATVAIASAEHINTLFPQAFFGDLPLGKGAPAWGMGGTGLAVPGDPEASSWNPAALAGVNRPWVTFSFTQSNLDGRPREALPAFDEYGESQFSTGVTLGFGLRMRLETMSKRSAPRRSPIGR